MKPELTFFQAGVDPHEDDALGKLRLSSAGLKRRNKLVYDQAAAFNASISIGSVIITKLDGHAKGGGALSAVVATQSPILFLGSGEKFDDFEAFHAPGFVSTLLGYGDTRALMDDLEGVKSSNRFYVLLVSGVANIPPLKFPWLEKFLLNMFCVKLFYNGTSYLKNTRACNGSTWVV